MKQDSKKSILLICHDEKNRTKLEEKLLVMAKLRSDQVEIVDSISAAIRAIRKHNFSFCLIDAAAPNSEVRDFLDDCWKNGVRTPVFYLRKAARKDLFIYPLAICLSEDEITEEYLRRVLECGEVLRERNGTSPGTQEEITEKLRAHTVELERVNARIEAEKAKDEAILASIADGILVTDAEGRVILVNRQFSVMFDIAEKDIIRKKMPAAILLQDERGQRFADKKRPIVQALESGKTSVLTGQYVTPKRDILPVQVTASPVVLDGKIAGAIAIFRDITKEKEIERTKNEFISTVSHELRTPLTSIREGVAQVYEEILGKVNDDQKEFLSIALEEVDRLAAIINDLLDISKIESGKLVLKKVWVDFGELVDETLMGYRSLMKSKSIELSSLMPQEPIEVYCDTDKIKQVLTNLLTNAFKFTSEGGKITVELTQDQDEIKVAVKDTGVGIAPQNIARLFDKFVQVGRTAGPGIKGTGLGLTISKNLVEMHEGEIWVRSKEGQGSDFCFSLPKLAKDLAARENIRLGLEELQGETQLSLIVLTLRPAENASRSGASDMSPSKVLKVLQKRSRRGWLSRLGEVFMNGAHEGIVLLPGMNKEEANEVAGKLNRELQDIMAVTDSSAFPFQVQMGVSTYPEDAENTESLLLKARVPMSAVAGGQDRRVAARTGYEMPIVVYRASGEAVELKSVDISSSGLRLHGVEPLKVGSLPTFSMHLPGDFGEVRTRGVIVWARREKSSGDWLMGVQFAGMSENVQQKIKLFVESEVAKMETDQDQEKSA